ncbi:MAG: metallophosphoesterase [Saprospiraceae bacterium]|nr:metallophosphoesterase [Saprospiraceae bacterium]
MKRYLPLVVLILFLDVYAFQAVPLLTASWSDTWRWGLTLVYWSIPVFSLAFLVSSATTGLAGWNQNVVSIVRSLLIIIYASKLLLAGALLIDDFRRLMLSVYDGLGGEVAAAYYSRSTLLAQVGLTLASIPLISLTYGMLRNRYRYRLHRHKVPVSDLPAALEGLRIVQISDIHTGSFPASEPVREAVALINREKPDLVFFTGDLVNYAAHEAEPFVDVFDKIQARHGVYSVLGNHDYGDYLQWPNADAKRQNMAQLLAIHRRLGWNLLLNEHRLLDINGEQVAVIGVENYSAHPRFPKYGRLTEAYEGAQQAPLKLLLSHDPSHWEEQVVPHFPDINVTFSGHTHGMQFGFEIRGWFKWSPIQYVYRQWAGLYTRGKQFLYVNRGLGFLGYPGRVGILPEITVMTLHRQ